MKKPNILFLCTGNSCRSQMAEGWAKHFYSHLYNFYSAGTVIHGLNNYAMQVMQEVGIDISSHFSKTIGQLTDINFDLVYTVCSSADKNCPIFPQATKIIHHGFDDPPSLCAGRQDFNTILPVYRRVRDEIKEFILTEFKTN